MIDLKIHKCTYIPRFGRLIRFGTKLYRQVVGIPMGTNCAPLVADLFLFCYERDFMMSLSDDNQADIIDSFDLVLYAPIIFRLLRDGSSWVEPVLS